MAFFALNAYFIVLSPAATIGNIFGLFGLGKIAFGGVSIMQFFVAFYPVAYWYSAFLSLTVLAALMGAFYFYSRSLRPLLAVAPAMIFFLSWRNMPIYGFSFVPLVLAVHFHKQKGRGTDADLVKSRRPLAYLACGIAVMAVLVAAYSHAAYVSSNLLRIRGVTPIIYAASTNGSAQGLGGVNASIANNNHIEERVSFYVWSRNPNGATYALGQTLRPLAAGEAGNYTISYQLPLTQSTTRIRVFAFSKDYIASGSVSVSELQVLANAVKG